MTAEVWVTARFAATHRWPGAPDAVAFLRDYHRHEFRVKLSVPVGRHDREVEFFMLKAELDAHLSRDWAGRASEASCEMIAADLLRRFPSASAAEVSEDGENGALVRRDGDCAPFHTPPPRKVPFYGTEAEGPRRGVPTLFVPGSCPPEQVCEAAALLAAAGRQVGQVYYGAGDDRAFHADTYRACREVAGSVGALLAVEVDRVTEEVAEEVGAVRGDTLVVGLTPCLRCDYLKVARGGVIYWVQCPRGLSIYPTAADDALFLLDRDVS